MTEKRFRVEKQTFDGYCIVDNHFDGYYAYEKQDLEKLCETLNDLSEENEKLKKQREELFYRERDTKNEWRTLKKENEQLKKLLECSRKEANDYCEELMGKDEFIKLYKRMRDELKEENEQLREFISEIYEKYEDAHGMNIENTDWF